MDSTPALNRRNFIRLSGFAAAGATLTACVSQPIQPVLPEEAAVSSPDEALDRLMVGNQRYVNNRTLPLNESASRRSEVAKGQSPFATIFSCVDSRVPPELVFDRGLGDLFVIRTAGHTLDQAVLGSLEFGVEELKIPLLLVMGHSKCGAVKATAEALEAHAHAHGSIKFLVEAITPAVEQAAGEAGDPLTNCINANIKLTLAKLMESQILSEAVADGRLLIRGGRYELESGKVELF